MSSMPIQPLVEAESSSSPSHTPPHLQQHQYQHQQHQHHQQHYQQNEQLEQQQSSPIKTNRTRRSARNSSLPPHLANIAADHNHHDDDDEDDDFEDEITGDDEDMRSDDNVLNDSANDITMPAPTSLPPPPFPSTYQFVPYTTHQSNSPVDKSSNASGSSSSTSSSSTNPSSSSSTMHSTPSSSSSSTSSSHPYQRPFSTHMGLSRDKIPSHFHHYLNPLPPNQSNSGIPISTPSSNSNNSNDIREVTPANITLRTPATSVEPTDNNQSQGQSQDNLVSNSSNILATVPTLEEQAIQMANNKEQPRYVDISEYLCMPQSEAAKLLKIPTSTLSKRWKEAALGRKWPHRRIAKLDKEILTILHNIPTDKDMPENVNTNLDKLMRKRQEILGSVLIRL
ncbi:hypothetical protein SAMD00019534_033300 [Acytostelium subglobosum LB1]|uniref:hypothetical protein n=1 Tax=Acytostelium subglobosum LB1 TaxID=1410327 RepID=UPI00064517A5|nr:hypothetical protein SAMD00019534_033300 [Acytostelium subglobosum LB1]GAM20155.1 hypothetical protein SAMD00019534_033300 [Acytostelium subglobosum LB1]|eukprot:XP_012759676.1 hypothetical protein SAMD00019534_033300 [Acytostelium subglobosum LB1]